MKACDIMENTEKKEINYIYTKRYSLSDKVLHNVCELIKMNYGLVVNKIEENDNGYVFLTKHGYSIADLSFDFQNGSYKKLNFHMGVVERETEANKRDFAEKRYQKFKLQRKKMVGRLTAGAMAVLFALGVFKALLKKDVVKEPVAIVEQHLNTIDSADDLVLVSWANYAMGLISDKAEASPYDYAKTQRENLYSDFSTVMINYYNYVDQIESGLPLEFTSSLIDKYHSAFRSAVTVYNEAIANSLYPEAVFSETPYADATLLNENGESFKNGNVSGELVDNENNVVLLDDDDTRYKVYVQASDVKNNNYSLDNLPDGSLVYNGEVYVSDDYLYDTDPSSPSMK